MNAIRPLIVDDSVVVRRTLAEVFQDVPEIRDCVVAANGRIALDMIGQTCPDIVILDMEMPTLNGLETLEELCEHHPELPVIMFSSLTETGASETIEALSMGATDYVTKPAGQRNFVETIQRIRNELIPKILAICKTREPATHKALKSGTESNVDEAPEIIAIGSSTGGPKALEKVLSQLPSDFGLPIVIAQHMPPIFTARLAAHLDSRCDIKVREASGTSELQPGNAWIAAGDGNLIVKRTGHKRYCQPVSINDEALVKPSVDVLFESVAKTFGAKCLAMVLSGMGSDGKIGCEYIRNAGGEVIVQDESSSVVWGMPGVVAQAGLANEIAPLQAIGEMIKNRTRQRLSVGPQSAFNCHHNNQTTT